MMKKYIKHTCIYILITFSLTLSGCNSEKNIEDTLDTGIHFADNVEEEKSILVEKPLHLGILPSS